MPFSAYPGVAASSSAKFLKLGGQKSWDGAGAGDGVGVGTSVGAGAGAGVGADRGTRAGGRAWASVEAASMRVTARNRDAGPETMDDLDAIVGCGSMFSQPCLCAFKCYPSYHVFIGRRHQ